MSYRIVPCSLAHLRELARTMRDDDRAEIMMAGYVPRHLLIGLWRRTAEPRCALILHDDRWQVAAAWGDTAQLLADDGSMWFFTAPVIEKLPLAFFREARRDIAERLVTRDALVADVAASYAKAIRFFTMLGFSVGAPRCVGQGMYRRMRIGAAPLVLDMAAE